MADQFSLVIQSLVNGVPSLLYHLLASTLLLIAASTVWIYATPFREIREIRAGNAAAGLALGGAVVSLAIPMAATLATSKTVVDILLWGAVALGLQLVALTVMSFTIPNLGHEIGSGNVAAAAGLVGVQIATALLAAAAMVG
jgi:putative membrane protein